MSGIKSSGRMKLVCTTVDRISPLAVMTLRRLLIVQETTRRLGHIKSDSKYRHCIAQKNNGLM